MMIFAIAIIVLGFGFYFISISNGIPFGGELVVSFFPYGIFLFLLGLILSSIQLGKYLYKKSHTPTRFQKYAAFFVIGFGALFMLYSGIVQKFYHQSNDQFEISTTEESGLKILFANIYKGNINYDAIKNLLETHDPDVVLFVEFNDQHKNELASFIEKKYPYINRTSWSKIFVGSVVFSKYPIDNLATETEPGIRRYGYFKISKSDQPFYFYEVHTSSPTSNKDFLNRNIQLSRLAGDINTIHASTKEENAKVIMLGDFNVTPRSPHYKNFIKELPTDWDNATRTMAPLYTRNLGEMLIIHEDFDSMIPSQIRSLSKIFRIFGAHIDHIFVNQQTIIRDLQSIKVPGSDHQGFLFIAH